MSDRIDVSSSKSLVLDLKFQGIARYAAYLCAPDGAGGWKVAKVLSKDGSSEDSQLDSFDVGMLAAGQESLFFINANMTSIATKGTVGLTARLLQDNKEIATRTATAEITTGGAIPVQLRLLVRGA